jgi:hypothetical protein
MRTWISFCLTLLLAATAFGAEWDTFPDTWDATDALGRALPTHDEVGPPREGKYVGIFYHIWLGAHGQAGPFNIGKIIEDHPGAMDDQEHEAWGPMHAFHHWGEPLFGYYLSDDAYVLGRHAQMLADAGVDVIVFDVTNQATYQKEYLALCKVFEAVRASGQATPQIAFLTPFWDPAKVVQTLYDDFYGPGLHKDLWFSWKGKPLILADPEKAPEHTRDFFTFRKPEPSYFTGPSGPNQWGWLEVYPQHAFKDGEGKVEMVTVGVAQNAVGDRLAAFSEKGSRGRSFVEGKETIENATEQGLNFAQQWKRALNLDPEFIFITGWNEWVAMRFTEFNGVSAPVVFVDMFTQEKSRDIEPMRGGHGDSYYYQMAANIRRFKGARPQPAASPPAEITIDGQFSDWAGVSPEFRDPVGDAAERNHPGWGDAGLYLNRTGRNDLALMKVARDAENIFFYARTADYLDMAPAPHWMMLFIDTDGDRDTGWEGFDFVVNRPLSPPTVAVVERYAGDGKWEVVGQAKCAPRGRELELGIPRSALGIEEKPVDLRFKWADNIVREGDIMQFWVNGDAAPPGRSLYRYYEAEPAPPPPLVE